MRAIRLFFMVALAVFLIIVALANRQMVTISLLPSNFEPLVGGQWALSMPVFLALFLAMVFGLLVGVVWEWLRESHLRAESSRRAQDLARLEREMGALRRDHGRPKDEVVAILDANPTPAPRPQTDSLPAVR